MIKKADIEKLAALARIEVEPGEMHALIRDLDEIVEYVSALDEVEVAAVPETIDTTPMRNVLRPDGDAHDVGVFTAALLAEVPAVKDDMVAVKAILNNGQ